MKIHIVCTMLVVTAGFYFHICPMEWCLLLLCIAGVLSAELINSSLESMIDGISPEWNSWAGKAKDMAAAAVLVLALAALLTGLIIFIPYISR